MKMYFQMFARGKLRLYTYGASVLGMCGVMRVHV